MTLARASRRYLLSMALGPVLALFVGVSQLTRDPGGDVFTAIVVLVLAAFLVAVPVLHRHSPRLWQQSALVCGVLAGAGLGVLDLVRGSGVLLGVLIFVVLALVPPLAVRNVAIPALPLTELATLPIELGFPVRGQADGRFLVRADGLAIRLRRRTAEDPAHDDAVAFRALVSAEVIQLSGRATVPLGQAFTVPATDGPAIRVVLRERDIREDEWIVPSDRAEDAVAVILARHPLARR